MTPGYLDDLVADLFVGEVLGDRERVARLREEIEQLAADQRQHVDDDVAAALARHARNSKLSMHPAERVDGPAPFYMGPEVGGVAWRGMQTLNPDRDRVHRRWDVEDAPARLVAVCEADLRLMRQRLEAAEDGLVEFDYGDYGPDIDRWRRAVASYEDKLRRLTARVSKPGPPKKREGRVWTGRQQSAAVEVAIHTRLKTP